MFLEELPEPLVPSDLIPKLGDFSLTVLHVDNATGDGDESCELLKTMCQQLLQPNYQILGYLVQHLLEAIKNQDVTKMSRTNALLRFQSLLRLPKVRQGVRDSANSPAPGSTCWAIGSFSRRVLRTSSFGSPRLGPHLLRRVRESCTSHALIRQCREEQLQTSPLPPGSPATESEMPEDPVIRIQAEIQLLEKVNQLFQCR